MTPEEILASMKRDGTKPEDLLDGFALSRGDLAVLDLALDMFLKVGCGIALKNAAEAGDLRALVLISAAQLTAAELAPRLAKMIARGDAKQEAADAQRACEQSNIDPKWTGVPPQGTA